ARWSVEGEFMSADRRIDYRRALAGVSTPVLAIAGAVDRLATPAAVQEALAHLPRGRTHYVEFGRTHGHSADYGHVDLVLGRAAAIRTGGVRRLPAASRKRIDRWPFSTGTQASAAP